MRLGGSPSSTSTLHNPLCYSGLIHMNGRVYDPTVGRFLSVDPVFQAPTNSQSVNPYSYVMNNPLSLVDPTGYVAATGMSIAQKDGGPEVTTNELSGDDKLEKLSDGSIVEVLSDGTMIKVSSINISDSAGDSVTMKNSGGVLSTTLNSGNGKGSNDTSAPNSAPGGAADLGAPSQRINTDIVAQHFRSADAAAHAAGQAYGDAATANSQEAHSAIINLGKEDDGSGKMVDNFGYVAPYYGTPGDKTPKVIDYTTKVFIRYKDAYVGLMHSHFDTNEYFSPTDVHSEDNGGRGSVTLYLYNTDHETRKLTEAWISDAIRGVQGVVGRENQVSFYEATHGGTMEGTCVYDCKNH